MSFGMNNIVIIDIKGVDYFFVIYGFRISEFINLLEKFVLADSQ